MANNKNFSICYILFGNTQNIYPDKVTNLKFSNKWHLRKFEGTLGKRIQCFVILLSAGTAPIFFLPVQNIFTCLNNGYLQSSNFID